MELSVARTFLSRSLNQGRRTGLPGCKDTQFHEVSDHPARDGVLLQLTMIRDPSPPRYKSETPLYIRRHKSETPLYIRRYKSEIPLYIRRHKSETPLCLRLKDADGLDIKEFTQPLHSQFTAVTRFLHTSEGESRLRFNKTVYCDCTRIDLMSHIGRQS